MREELLQENEILKEGYIKLLNDIDVMTNWGKPQLEALYATKIGIYQLEKLKIQLNIKALKRKTELIHQAINKGEIPDLINIELKIAAELCRAEEQILQQTANIENAKFILTHLASPERSAALRKIFKHMAKQIHPDVNPDMTADQLNIWYKIKDAYQTGDLERLKALQIVFEEQLKNSKQSIEKLSDEELIIRNEALKQGIILLEEEITLLKNKFPFSFQGKINDDVWVDAQQKDLKEEIEQLQAYQTTLQNDFNQLTNGY